MTTINDLLRKLPLSRLLLAITLGLGSMSLLTACDRDEGPMEETAESFDEGAEEISDEIDDHTTN
ncbi:MAG: hypothetical protein R3221_11455 [Spongiibacter sp.]|uniref:Secreted protein n=1 Tax=Spongiibacter thalassae TaxID=2721624 RepID=A0ABX1GDY4_9GAMM|nr:hypothetical protein [Spongiibacter thalassae]MDX1506326.1 hypothetical protein [Spongiibacter sp.]NKI17141.1 hypothetical protein [Spongiibacter thalassae]